MTSEFTRDSLLLESPLPLGREQSLRSAGELKARSVFAGLRKGQGISAGTWDNRPYTCPQLPLAGAWSHSQRRPAHVAHTRVIHPEMSQTSPGRPHNLKWSTPGAAPHHQDACGWTPPTS